MEPDNQVVAERYQLIRRIGSGGMADVFLAHDTRLDRQVAVKVLYRSHGADATMVERFKREAHAAASLDHPGIVSIYDWGETGETSYIVMAYIAGDSLKQVLGQRGPLPQIEALGIARQVTAALAAAHAQGIVHRDIKPHNILLRPDGQVCVTDFGIARVLDQTSVTTGHVVLGSALYLSPEQAQGQEIDTRSDIYSLGVVMFELLTGRTPFSGDSLPSLALQHLTQTPPAPSEFRPDITPNVDAVVLKALKKQPGQRYQSASEMGAAIDAAREQLAGGAERRIAPPTPQPRPAPPDLAVTAAMASSVAETTLATRTRERAARHWPLTLGLAGLLLTGLFGLFASATGHWSGILPSRAGGIVVTPSPSATASPLRLVQPASTVAALATPSPAPSPTNTPTPAATPTATKDSTPNAKSTPTPSPTSAPATEPPAPTPTTAPEPTPTVAPTTPPPTPTSVPTPSPTPPPSPTPISTAGPRQVRPRPLCRHRQDRRRPR